MCGACGFPSRPGHWTDAGATNPSDRLRLRYMRLVFINRLLKPYRLSATDNGAVPGFQLSTQGGRRVICQDLEMLWQEAMRLVGEPIDPLNEQVLGNG